MSGWIRYTAGMLSAVLVALCGADECCGTSVLRNSEISVQRTSDHLFSASMEPVSVLRTDPVLIRWANERTEGRSVVRRTMEQRAATWLRSRNTDSADAELRGNDFRSVNSGDDVSCTASAMVSDFLDDELHERNIGSLSQLSQVTDIERVTDSLNPDALCGISSERREAIDVFLNISWSVPTAAELRVDMAMRAIGQTPLMELPPATPLTADDDEFPGSAFISMVEIHTILTEWTHDTVQLAMWIAPLNRAPQPPVPVDGVRCVLMICSPSGAGFSFGRGRISCSPIPGELPAGRTGFSDFFHDFLPVRAGFSRISQTTIRRE
jgi:hypothetical protein